jgi:type II secretory pathway component PulF
MAVAGEQSGGLPEVFAELEKHFRLVQKLQRQLWSQLTWPIFELVVGVLVVSVMLLVLGALGASFDPIGLGTGVPGALAFAGLIFGAVGLLVGVFLFLRRKPSTERFLLSKPVIGPCLMALALQRFSVALRLTSGTGMPIARALQLSLRATGNVTFVAATDAVVHAVEKGEELTRALERGRVFPREYLDVLAGAEVAGRLDDVLEHQANFYEEESERRMAALTKMLGYAIRVLIMALLVFLIFRMWLSYFGEINKVLPN